MKFSRRGLIVSTFIHAATITILVASASSSSSSSSYNDETYTKYPPGVTTYGFDDGGCFFCARESRFLSKEPLTGGELNEHCRRQCEADRECVAYTVGRPEGEITYIYISIHIMCVNSD